MAMGKEEQKKEDEKKQQQKARTEQLTVACNASWYTSSQSMCRSVGPLFKNTTQFLSKNKITCCWNCGRKTEHNVRIPAFEDNSLLWIVCCDLQTCQNGVREMIVSLLPKSTQVLTKTECHSCLCSIKTHDSSKPSNDVSCQECKTIHYCSESCRSTDKEKHQLECQPRRPCQMTLFGGISAPLATSTASGSSSSANENTQQETKKETGKEQTEPSIKWQISSPLFKTDEEMVKWPDFDKSSRAMAQEHGATGCFVSECKTQNQMYLQFADCKTMQWSCVLFCKDHQEDAMNFIKSL